MLLRKTSLRLASLLVPGTLALGCTLLLGKGIPAHSYPVFVAVFFVPPAAMGIIAGMSFETDGAGVGFRSGLVAGAVSTVAFLIIHSYQLSFSSYPQHLEFVLVRETVVMVWQKHIGELIRCILVSSMAPSWYRSCGFLA